MGAESQDTLYVLAELGVIERHDYQGTIRYDINCGESYWRPEMKDLKILEKLCGCDKMWIDSDDHIIYLEYNTACPT